MQKIDPLPEYYPAFLRLPLILVIVTPGIRLLSPSGKTQNKKKRSSAHFASKKVILPDGFPTTDVAGPDLVGGNSTLTGCDTLITPACIRALYGIPTTNLAVAPRADNSLGIFEEGDFYFQADLNSFFKQFQPTIPAGKYILPVLQVERENTR